MLKWLALLGCLPRKPTKFHTRRLSMNHDKIPFLFMELPADLKRKVADFLPVRDALRLRQTSSRNCSDLGLTVRPPFQILQEDRWQGDLESSESPRIATVIPIFDGRKTHSITLSCQCYNQDGRGKFYVVAHRSEDDDFSMSSGTIVTELDFTGRSMMRKPASFRPQFGEMYYLWYKIVGGAQSQLHLSPVRIHAVVYE